MATYDSEKIGGVTPGTCSIAGIRDLQNQIIALRAMDRLQGALRLDLENHLSFSGTLQPLPDVGSAFNAEDAESFAEDAEGTARAMVTDSPGKARFSFFRASGLLPRLSALKPAATTA